MRLGVALAAAAILSLGVLGGAPEGTLGAVIRSAVSGAVFVAAAAACAWRAARDPGGRAAYALLGAALLTWLVAAALGPPHEADALAAGDVLFLAGIAAMGAALVTLAQRAPHSVASVLDGAAGAATAVALVGLVVVGPMADSVAGGSAPAILAIAYPVSDGVLFGTVSYALAVRGWRVSRDWGFVGAGLLALGIADCAVSLSPDTAAALDEWQWLYALAGASLLAAAHTRSAETAEPSPSVGLRASLGPVVFAAAALAIVAASGLTDVHPLAFWAALVSLGLSLTRTALTLAENARLLSASARDAATDSLSGLGNRRALVTDLSDRLTRGTDAVLALLDLDGFKSYNDSHGHLEGDALLIRLGAVLRKLCAGRGRAYRLGGDEFCLLIDGGVDRDALAGEIRAGVAALGTGVSASVGLSEVGQAPDISACLRLADQRLYVEKRSRRAALSPPRPLAEVRGRRPVGS